MTPSATRKIVKIDEDKCTGCGLCVPSCAEGAIRIINGKARLMAENLCDGLGNCLGHCPFDAITIEDRPAEAFDEAAVEKHLHADATAAAKPQPPAHGHGGCPGSMLRQFKRPVAAAVPAGAPAASQLQQWPVQLALVPVAGPIWQDADVLIAADCIPFAMADFHNRLLAGKTLAIACPKLDTMEPYIEKLAAIIAGNTIKSITVAHMEVPCCGGIVYAVHEAIARARRSDIPVTDVTVGIDGAIKEQN